MVITVRGARACELPAVRDIISSAWENPEDEPALWDYVFSSHPGFSPQGVRVAFAGERPVACAVVLPCRLRTPRGLAPGAELTLVGCRPEYQRQGYGGAVVRDALAYMAGRGLALAVFWGDPLFYGRFGAVPVLPVYRTTLDVGATRPPSLLTDPAPDLRPAEEEDLKAVAALYRWGLSSYLLVTRYRTPDDLLLAGQAKLLDAGALASDAALSRLRADFRSGPLRYFEAPYFFWL